MLDSPATNGAFMLRAMLSIRVTMALVLLNLMVFLAPDLLASPPASKVALGAQPPWPAVLEAPWTLISSAFVHGDAEHISVNLLVLVPLSAVLEAQLGWVRHVLFCVACVLCSSITTLVLQAGAYSLGASGLVFGVLGACAALAVRPHGQLGLRTVDNLRIAMPGLVLASVMSSFGADVGWAAHMSGLVLGFVCCWTSVVFRGLRRPHEGVPLPAWEPLRMAMTSVTLMLAFVHWSLSMLLCAAITLQLLEGPEVDETPSEPELRGVGLAAVLLVCACVLTPQLVHETWKGRTPISWTPMEVSDAVHVMAPGEVLELGDELPPWLTLPWENARVRARSEVYASVVVSDAPRVDDGDWDRLSEFVASQEASLGTETRVHLESSVGMAPACGSWTLHITSPGRQTDILYALLEDRVVAVLSSVESRMLGPDEDLFADVVAELEYYLQSCGT